MQATNEREGATKIASQESPEHKKTLRVASTKEVRALLSDLSLRPLSQREFFCRLLKRAAVHAASKDSAVDTAESHHTSTS